MKLVVSKVKAIVSSDVHSVWDIVLDVRHYSHWRSDISKMEIIDERQFIEYSQEGYPTTFTITVIEPYKRWEFDMENTNIRGHWSGCFYSKEDGTEIEFIESVEAKKFFMKPFIKSYLKKQQTQFISDLKKALEDK